MKASATGGPTLRPFSALLAPLVLLAATASGGPADTDAYAPRKVVALPGGPASVLVSWVPGDVPADSYRVYGLNAGAAPVRIHDTATDPTVGTVATVGAGFATYAVSGVHDGQESTLVQASEPCIVIILFPEPGYSVCKGGPILKLRSLP